MNDNAQSAKTETLAEWTASALNTAKHLRIKSKPIANFSLTKKEQAILSAVPSIPKKLRDRLTMPEAVFTFAEVAALIIGVSEELENVEGDQHLKLKMIANAMTDCLYDAMAGKAKSVRKATKKSKSTKLFQFKVTLLGIAPTIWRRFQTHDCTLDDLHFLIQGAMGWRNSHLYEFQIEGERYGDPELMEGDFDEMPFKDSTTTLLSEILPTDGRRFRFKYIYDFGDDWNHGITFEGCPSAEDGRDYPLCLEGERACPPEDVGGIVGYGEFLRAIADPKHEMHKEFMRWAGKFDPEAFDPGDVQKRLREIAERR